MEIQNIYVSRNIIREYEYIVDDLLLFLFVFFCESVEDFFLFSSQVFGVSNFDFGDDSYEYIYIDEFVLDKFIFF